MTDESKNNTPEQPGIMKRAFDASGDLQWKAIEAVAGKEGATLHAQATEAYMQGKILDGVKLAWEGNKSAAKRIKTAIFGGEDVKDPGAPLPLPTPAKGHGKETPKR